MDYSNIVKKLNPRDIPMVQCHAYKWLNDGGYSFNRIQSKRNYLRSLGFRVGIDCIDEEAISLLNLLISFVFNMKYRK